MDRAKTYVNDLKNPKSTSFKITAVIFVIALITYLYLRGQRIYYKENPSFVRKSHDGKTAKTVESSKFSKSNAGDEVTFHFWMYVDNVIYNYGKVKNVFTKGLEGVSAEEQCPGVYIAPKANDLNIIITTTTKNDVFKLADFPIRKWFSIGIVCKGTQVDFYKDGLLEFSKNLSGIAKPNTGNMYICQDGGFDGMVSCIQYFPNAKGPKLMSYKHKRGPICLLMIEKIWAKITGKLASLKNSINISVELDVDVDAPKYTTLEGSMCQGDTIADLGVIEIEGEGGAKEKCNADPKCDCITEMVKGMGDLPKGNIRLVNNYNTGDRTVTQSGFNAYEVERSAVAGLFNSLTNTASSAMGYEDVDYENEEST